ncbi:hypothetical protein Q762_09850 [Flavobacterium cauense R2A-7]|nr:hypothetical protein Q762_09850 [Flavobacterium cauense R2A-7]
MGINLLKHQFNQQKIMKRKTLNLEDFTRNQLTKKEQKTIKGSGDTTTPEDDKKDPLNPIPVKGNGNL